MQEARTKAQLVELSPKAAIAPSCSVLPTSGYAQKSTCSTVARSEALRTEEGQLNETGASTRGGKRYSNRDGKPAKRGWQPAQVGRPQDGSNLPLPDEICIALIKHFCAPGNGLMNLGRLLLTCRAWYHLINNEAEFFRREAMRLRAKHRKPLASWLATYVEQRLHCCSKCAKWVCIGNWSPFSRMPRSRDYSQDIEEPRKAVICLDCEKLPAYHIYLTMHDVPLRIRQAANDEELQKLLRPHARLPEKTYWVPDELEAFAEHKQQRAVEALAHAMSLLSDDERAEIEPVIQALPAPDDLSIIVRDERYTTCVDAKWTELTKKCKPIGVEDLRGLLALHRAQEAVLPSVEAKLRLLPASEYAEMAPIVEAQLQRGADYTSADHGLGRWSQQLAMGNKTTDDFLAYLRAFYELKHLREKGDNEKVRKRIEQYLLGLAEPRATPAPSSDCEGRL